MNRLIQSPQASDPIAQQPFPVASPLFIQDAIKEALNNLMLNSIPGTYSTSKVYVLFGCVATGTDPGARTVSAGAVFYNGEIYTVPAASFTTTGVDVAVANIVVTNPSPDPILLKDGTSVNVHNVRQVVISAGSSGSGIADLSDFVPATGTYVQTSQNNGQALSADVGFTYSGLTTYYNYKIVGKTCVLDFLLDFTVTGGGATISYLRIPLPANVTKITAINPNYSTRGFCAWIAPGGTTNFESMYVNGTDDSADGQYLQIRRMGGGATGITMSAVATTLKGHVEFPIA